MLHQIVARRPCTACTSSMRTTKSRQWLTKYTAVCANQCLLKDAFFTFDCTQGGGAGVMVVLRTAANTAHAQMHLLYSETCADLVSVFVDPCMRGKGLASALIVAMAYCVAHLFRITAVRVEDSSDRAGCLSSNLYRSLGFLYADESDFHTDEPMHAYISNILPQSPRAWAITTGIQWPSGFHVSSGPGVIGDFHVNPLTKQPHARKRHKATASRQNSHSYLQTLKPDPTMHGSALRDMWAADAQHRQSRSTFVPANAQTNSTATAHPSSLRQQQKSATQTAAQTASQHPADIPIIRPTDLCTHLFKRKDETTGTPTKR
jgi:GNAT superfamily N-acetyltransferase